MGTRHAASRLGTSRRNIASARSSATRGRPPYFRACTAARAPASSHTAERAACSAAGQSAHNRQGPKCGSGWPQRRHHGGCTGRQRWRQMSHTTRRDVGKENSARHTRHSAGRSSCSSASRTERPVHGGPHHRSEEHTSELQSLAYLVCRLLLEKKKKKHHINHHRTRNKSTDAQHDVGRHMQICHDHLSIEPARCRYLAITIGYALSDRTVEALAAN